MPKHRRAPRVFRRTEPIRNNRDGTQKQFCSIQRDKENSHNSLEDSTNDPILTYMKVEVKQEELDTGQTIELSDEINIPLKIEQFETLNYDSIKEEDAITPDTNLNRDSNKDFNILIEWALNLQFEHSKRCKGRLYPYKDIDNFRCKIVVLYCTVCKKRMLHALKDWVTF